MPDHIHTYERIKGKKTLYMCIQPTCKYYTDSSLLLNKQATCRYCGNLFILDSVQLKRKNPRCPDCRKNAKKAEIDPLLDKLLEESGSL